MKQREQNRARSQQMGHELPEAVVKLLANRIDGNVREIRRVLAYASLCNKPIDMEIAHQVVRGILVPEQDRAKGHAGRNGRKNSW